MKRLLSYYNTTGTILVLAVLGGLFGYFFPNIAMMLKPIGLLFINLIKMLIIPIIFISILHSIISIKVEDQNIAKTGSFILFYFFIASFIAGLFGLVVALFFQPGIGNINLPQEFLTLDATLQKAVQIKPQGFWDFIFSVIPNNPLSALVEGNLLSIVFFTIFFAIAVLNIKHSYKDYLVHGVSVVNDALMWMISRIMFLAPIAVFSLMSYLIGTMGFDIIVLAGKLISNIVIVEFAWVYIVLGIVVLLFSKIGYLRFIKETLNLQLIAFSTSSSLVSLPVNKRVCEKFGVSPSIIGLVLPVGSSIHMNGSAAYYTIVAIFFAQLFGIPLVFTDYLMIALVAAIGSIATPGIPGLSLSIVMVLAVANIPLIGLPLIFAIDRLLDMLITTVNVMGNTTCALVTEKTMNRKGF